MVFKQNIPQPNDIIAQSQRDIKENFEETYNIWGKSPTESENIGDHMPLDTPEETDRGKHKKVTLIEQDPIPVAAANEAILYSEPVNGITELHYTRNLDATGSQLTSNRRLNVGGLVLRAYAVFDFTGKILERETLDDEGDTVKVPLSFNVGTIDQLSSTQSQWTINFTNPLGTNDYIWICQSFNNTRVSDEAVTGVFNAQPAKNGTYSDSVNSNYFVFMNANTPNNLPAFQPAINVGLRMVFQAYTVI